MVQDGQVVLIRFSNTDQAPGKLRPALIIRRLPGRHDDWLICLISSSLSQEVSGFDNVVLETDEHFEDSGLKKSSLIRIGRLAAVERTLFVGSIGKVALERLREIAALSKGDWDRQAAPASLGNGTAHVRPRFHRRTALR